MVFHLGNIMARAQGMAPPLDLAPLPSSVGPTSPGVVPPPPGVTPNFLHPASLQHQIVAANVACLVIAVLFMSMRIWTRLFITRSIGWDDYTCIMAMAFSVAYSVGSIQLLKYGLGIHIWDLLKSNFDADGFLNWSIITYMMYIPTICLVKLSILLLYLRLFSNGRTVRYTVYGILSFVVSYNIAAELSLIFGCRPVRKTFHQELSGTCIDFQRHAQVVVILNIVSDIALYIVPIPIAWSLQIPKRQKIAVIAIFLTASVSCVASVVHLSALVQPNQHDPTWQQFTGIAWSLIEINLAIISCCMPAFKPFLQHLTPRIRQMTSKAISSISSSKRPNAADNGNTVSSNDYHHALSRFSYPQSKTLSVEVQHQEHHDDVSGAGAGARVGYGPYSEMGDEEKGAKFRDPNGIRRTIEVRVTQANANQEKNFV